VNTAVAASIYCLVAVGFGLVYSGFRFFHFAHGALYVAGAYACYAARIGAGLPLWCSALLGIGVSAILGAACDLLVYRHLRKRRAGATALFVASMGLYAVIQNAIAMIFGDTNRTIRTWSVVEGHRIGDARISTAELCIVGVAVVLIATTAAVLRYTKAGIALRALSADADLSRCAGVDLDRSAVLVLVVASGLAGCAGVLIALDTDITPQMGFWGLLMGVVATIVGGIGRPAGALLGAVLIAAAQQISIWYLPSQWKDAVAFGVLFLALVLRPHGLMGQPIRKATV